jgi:hypothetical protein
MADNEVIKTVGIKLKTTKGQDEELKKLFEAFRLGINWSLNKIEMRYQVFLKDFTPVPDDMQIIAFCSVCHEEKSLEFKNRAGDFVCPTCARRTYSEYTVRKEIYGVGERKVKHDLKDVVEIEAKTHYTMLFSQAYAIWKSYNSWRNKRLKAKEALESELASLKDRRFIKAAQNLEIIARNIRERNPELPWKLAKAQAVRATNLIFRKEEEQKEIERLYGMIMEHKRLSIPIHFPQITECKTVMISQGFVKWAGGKLHMTLWEKEKKEIEYYGKKYLYGYLFNWNDLPGKDDKKLKKFLIHKFGVEWVKEANVEKTDNNRTIKINGGENILYLELNNEKTEVFLEINNSRAGTFIAVQEGDMLNIYSGGYIVQMEKDSTYCNLTKKDSQYYLMYPFAIKVKQPPDLKECDTFVFISSPKRTAILGYDSDGMLNSVKWFDTGVLVFVKRNFREKRAEIGRRRSDYEKMRSIRRRKKKIKTRGTMEMRYVSTFNHQLTRKMIDYVMEQSENPKILLWDVGNGITQNFGRTLNYLKNLWAAVQQQEYLQHKAAQVSIPIVQIKYNTCNNLICSSCGAVQMNGKKPAKVITQLIKDIKNFKCEKCGYEVNMLINQASNIVAVEQKK